MTVKSLKNAVRKFVAEQSGATAIEYGLIAGLIAVAIILAVSGVGTELAATFTDIKSELTSANAN